MRLGCLKRVRERARACRCGQPAVLSERLVQRLPKMANVKRGWSVTHVQRLHAMLLQMPPCCVVLLPSSPLLSREMCRAVNAMKST
jgi:hypothetical protein